MRSAVVTFPGSNCDDDAVFAIRDVLGAQADLISHTCTDLSEYDLIVLPGGFSYGDHLRCGAIARFAPVMGAVRVAVDRGVAVLGICNGFQVLCEAGLVPGALVRNASMQFRCDIVDVEVVSDDSIFTGRYTSGDVLRLPIAHGEGNYVVDEVTLAAMQSRGQVAFRYAGANPNGSVAAIAGVTNERGNVLGMMPHPERAVSDLLGSCDGAALFISIAESVHDHSAA